MGGEMMPGRLFSGWFAALGVSLLVVFAAMGADDDDDAAVDDDSSPGWIDDDEPVIGCEGWYREACDSVDNPQLLSLELHVNGVVTGFPAEVSPGDKLEFVFGYAHLQCGMYEGYPFVVAYGEAICLSDQQFLNLFCNSEAEGPAMVEIDPSYFVNGDGAPYGFEISDTCGHHSNRLPVDIVTTAGDDDSDDDDEDEARGCGC